MYTNTSIYEINNIFKLSPINWILQKYDSYKVYFMSILLISYYFVSQNQNQCNTSVNRNKFDFLSENLILVYHFTRNLKSYQLIFFRLFEKSYLLVLITFYSTFHNNINNKHMIHFASNIVEIFFSFCTNLLEKTFSLSFSR